MLVHKGTVHHSNVWQWTDGASVFRKLLVESLASSCREPDGPLQRRHSRALLHMTRTSVCCHQLEACCSASSPAGSTWTGEQVCSFRIMTYASSQRFGHTCFFFVFKTFYPVGMQKTLNISPGTVHKCGREKTKGKYLNMLNLYYVNFGHLIHFVLL